MLSTSKNCRRPASTVGGGGAYSVKRLNVDGFRTNVTIFARNSKLILFYLNKKERIIKIVDCLMFVNDMQHICRQLLVISAQQHQHFYCFSPTNWVSLVLPKFLTNRDKFGTKMIVMMYSCAVTMSLHF